MLDKFLDKIPTDKIYEQLLQPSFQNVGEALGTLFSLGNLVLLPLKLQDQKARLRFDANLKRYAKKLEETPAEEICEVPPHVGLPLLDKLTYLDQQELSEAFINLLTKASTRSTAKLVHPSFVMALNNLAADEARILFHYKHTESIPRLDLYVKKEAALPSELVSHDHVTNRQGKAVRALQPPHEVHTRIAWNLTGIEMFVPLDFPENVDVYIENLEKLGIVALEQDVQLKKDLKTFQQLERKIYKPNISKSKKWVQELNQKHPELQYTLYTRKSYYYFTEYGKMFLKACIREIGENSAEKDLQ